MAPGLCESCEHARRIVSAKGSVFWLCAMAEQVAGWPKYPRLPVLRCGHHRVTPTPA